MDHMLQYNETTIYCNCYIIADPSANICLSIYINTCISGPDPAYIAIKLYSILSATHGHLCIYQSETGLEWTCRARYTSILRLFHGQPWAYQSETGLEWTCRASLIRNNP